MPMQVFADFREDHKRDKQPFANYSFMEKKIVQLILQIGFYTPYALCGRA